MQIAIHSPLPIDGFGVQRFAAVTFGTGETRRLLQLIHPIEYNMRQWTKVCGHARREIEGAGIVVGTAERYIFIPFSNIAMIQECNKVLKDDAVLVLE